MWVMVSPAAFLPKGRMVEAEAVHPQEQYINNVMRARAGNVPAVWQRILDELGLELVVRPKDPPI